MEQPMRIMLVRTVDSLRPPASMEKLVAAASLTRDEVRDMSRQQLEALTLDLVCMFAAYAKGMEDLLGAPPMEKFMDDIAVTPLSEEEGLE